MIHFSMLFGLLFLSLSSVAHAVVTISAPVASAMYGTFEMVLTAPGVSGNKFTKFPTVTFTQGTRSMRVEGFHDGGNIWRVRFMPDAQGLWKYSWSFQGASGSGSVSVSAVAHSHNHGHVKRSGRYLKYDDGTPHYFYGGKWIAGTHYGPQTKEGHPNPGYHSDQTFLNYLDELNRFKHNGLLLKNSLYPLEHDKLSWDLEWVRRGEWLVKQAGARGIYVQVGMFDTWSRDDAGWFLASQTNGSFQVFNVWADEDDVVKRNYIRYIVARYGGLYNVYWELGNEMGHAPNNGSSFATLANSKYIPWIRNADPYDLPIGLSETDVAAKTNVDIVFHHQTNVLPSQTAMRPAIMNELVRGGVTGASLWDDQTIRSSADRYSYRRTFYSMFMIGGSGSSEATWLRIDLPLNTAVFNVMGDHQRLRTYIESLPTSINLMNPTNFIVSGPGTKRSRAKTGEVYSTYLQGGPGQNIAAGKISANLPAGSYKVTYYNPKTAVTTSPIFITGGSTAVQFAYPAFHEDLVMTIVRSTLPPHSVLPPTNLRLRHTALLECSNASFMLVILHKYMECMRTDWYG